MDDARTCEEEVVDAAVANGSYVTWSPVNSSTDAINGALVVSGKTLGDSDGEQAPGSGETLLVTTDFDEFAEWTSVSAPLAFDDEFDTGHGSAGRRRCSPRRTARSCSNSPPRTSTTDAPRFGTRPRRSICPEKQP